MAEQSAKEAGASNVTGNGELQEKLKRVTQKKEEIQMKMAMRQERNHRRAPKEKNSSKSELFAVKAL